MPKYQKGQFIETPSGNVYEILDIDTTTNQYHVKDINTASKNAAKWDVYYIDNNSYRLYNPAWAAAHPIPISGTAIPTNAPPVINRFNKGDIISIKSAVRSEIVDVDITAGLYRLLGLDPSSASYGTIFTHSIAYIDAWFEICKPIVENIIGKEYEVVKEIIGTGRKFLPGELLKVSREHVIYHGEFILDQVHKKDSAYLMLDRYSMSIYLKPYKPPVCKCGMEKTYQHNHRMKCPPHKHSDWCDCYKG